MAVRLSITGTDQKSACTPSAVCWRFCSGRVIEFQARQLHYTQGLSGLLDVLGTVRLAMVLRPAGTRVGDPDASGH